jgi:hypothetical protein
MFQETTPIQYLILKTCLNSVWMAYLQIEVDIPHNSRDTAERRFSDKLSTRNIYTTVIFYQIKIKKSLPIV